MAEQRNLLAGSREPTGVQERALIEGIATFGMEVALLRAAESMLDALRWDAARGESAPSEHDLTTQIARIGHAYADAMWTCSGQSGSAPDAARTLACLATRAHHLRDLAIDFRLGYCNVSREEMDRWPAGELSIENLEEWAKRSAAEIDAAFARTLPALAGLPWRPRALYTMLAWSYRRILTRPLEMPVFP